MSLRDFSAAVSVALFVQCECVCTCGVRLLSTNQQLSRELLSLQVEPEDREVSESE